ncbi:unnamed protein product [Acanthoscelides obtectus]|uniref:Zinc finger CCCH domain-containing protein 14 n=1 Tax=Acanthoscelides obtectus TaxID=200917 RepID=A0A9P0KUQ6_ACAOB|nr:unnamed protein product [Acanthoscelides obtectus]CAK1672082.1 Zinc finger CCCH domain-containing protein 14 [Acanthoscelides obtectus]
MDTIGAEVGQKMRSAIKAKLLELSCYVDDELPDYIMVMVANKRTKSQMNEDLHLFLNDKTETFVEWLHIVLKKLKEVTVTNPEVYKRVAKRKSDNSDAKVKKEKKTKKSSYIALKPEDKPVKDKEDLNKIAENRKITVLDGSEDMQDKFDIPLLSEVNASNKESLEEIEQRIRNVKSRLGLLVDSDIEIELDDKEPGEDMPLRSFQPIAEMKQELKKEKLKESNVEEALSSSIEYNLDTTNNVEESEPIQSSVENKRSKHKPISFEDDSPPPKKLSVRERLGKKNIEIRTSDFRKTRLNLESRHNQERDKSDERRDRSRERRDRSRETRDRSRDKRDRSWDAGNRRSEHQRDDRRRRDRIGDSREIKSRDTTRKDPRTETEKDGSRTESLLKKISNSKNEEIVTYNTRKLPQSEKTKLRNLILSEFARENRNNSDGDDDDNDDKGQVYVPKPIRHTKSGDIPKYVPSSQRSSTGESGDGEEEETLTERIKRKFADRLEGIGSSASRSKKSISEERKTKPSIKSRLDGKKSPSPIIFDKDKERKIKISQVATKIDVPDRLPVVHPPLTLKNKERCKYWPGCRQGDKCEFVHPTTSCEAFPNCKFGESCLYIHPPCKFGSSCTKRDCVYDHILPVKTAPRALGTLQQCKFFPTCTNINCQFYHPKMCKFGKFCKNQADCSFSHLSIAKPKPAGLSWRSSFT